MPGFVQVPVDVADNWRAESAFLHGVIAVSGFHDRADASEDIVAYIERIAASSPVAPVGALTEELRKALELAVLQNELDMLMTGDELRQARALLSAQGCELATDATKQLGEPSVHLAATPIDQDFRRRPASSEAAPSAEGSGQ